MKDTITIELEVDTARRALKGVQEASIINPAVDYVIDELETAISAYDEANSPEPLVRDDVSYVLPAHKQFILDMEAAGFDIRLYNGRNFYHGPSVVVGVITQVTSRTRVPVRWDNLGFDFIVHPSQSDSRLKR